MTEIKRPVNEHKAYHAHVYFDASTKPVARELREAANKQFGLPIGRMHEKFVGPHPRWSCQITFGARDFDSFIPWLDANRNGLSILVHALTGDDLRDHTDFAYWLGDPVTLDLSIFK